MRQFTGSSFSLNNRVKIYWLLPAIGFFWAFSVGNTILAQDSLVNPVEKIRELKQGYLIIRFPSFKNKIDTLDAMIARAKDGPSKQRLVTLREEAIEERDLLREEYISAFTTHYNYSKVAYFMDYESRDLPTAVYHRLNGEKISYDELHQQPVFYLQFSRTKDSKIDALVIYDEDLQYLPSPFPNNFSRGGFNFLFITLSSDKYAEWRVKRMNRKLHRFWDSVN